ncbi:2-oxoglutarate dehydrogenase E1 component [Parageobacillus thermoglucosidasius]|uniref:2-oxoglutarate dehydrogenase E1 component n=1 Tax=Geobacillus sp. (strain Y4.1MC1) TaxID=581103 RepID=A0A7U4DLV9_GEOS0|nr:2-oxoglutarate dehydrogenase E1 component [Parageobacillus thermoglucosidasius]MED4903304.1 2-oxoglutarate dehydrogenase E1 component [Parageobacillus thermoglucosidasius]MED4914618.1 2-oxoglutarate dehydrogenase E1 component [Parageobacillus thermoglucosidasius]MED4946244.1 2-oxoglutarate dehydrogenase E1 component [Parageobacillus thermoglucosidasius]MED4982574.1 2-oxoglutarate dehydrogenase E1 component [Parageobacillus thermoglucosidasius]RDE27946.1 2-oxoglutarate dehydrogenase E1 compo
MAKQTISNAEPWSQFYGPNLGYVMEKYEQYLEDPDSVDPELKQLFEQWGAPPAEAERFEYSESAAKTHQTFRLPENPTIFSKLVAAVKLADNIRHYGHLAADVNPLNKQNKDSRRIELSEFDLTEEDLKEIPVPFICPHAPSHVRNGLDAINHLRKIYTDKIAFEFSQVHNLEEKNWLIREIESGAYYPSLSNEEKVALLRRLTEVEGFEKFLHRTFVGQKRFSIEGLDSMVPLLDELVRHSIENEVKAINIGMAHRGRLNVLAHVLGKPYEMIFAEFQHAESKDFIPSEGSVAITYGWTGDVKYHLGAARRLRNKNEHTMRITLANNPSHLEVVSPVVLGFTRAAQEDRSNAGVPSQDTDSSFAIMIHGDAAFPGQGIVAETLNLSRLRGYQTGGSIHIIANNMIGFTTESYDSRSTRYASDIAKGFEIPIVHVNADDPEACLAAANLAFKYRQRFKKDFVIDLIGYRRFGHNEMDEPMATNPTMYNVIQQHPTVRQLYAQKLVEKGVIAKEAVEEMEREVAERLKNAYERVPKDETKLDFIMDPPKPVARKLPFVKTAVEKEVLRRLNKELLQFPPNFHVFNKLERILKRRDGVFDGNGKIDWAHAEILAFATILRDGVPIRLTGQDSQRGTFAQRHLVLHDVKTGEEFVPLHHISEANASFVVYNSPLTEAAVLGYEYGYNVFAPETLVLWEAQFGDFANMAQVMFDQFISSGRAKWGQKSGLVMLLPHGYEGQGPEHSSARLERFLQLAAENNWTVANLSTSAQYFHILRRQASILQWEEVRPLVLMTPKSLLRHPLAASDVEEFTNGQFQPVLEQKGLGENREKVERIILGTGKLTVDLAEQINKMEGLDWLHVVRIEELYPFPKEELQAILVRYPNIKEIVWVQEEPQNMGSWCYVEPKLREIAPDGVEVSYIGRRRRASPAEGDPVVHRKEQERIIQCALTKKEQ